MRCCDVLEFFQWIDSPVIAESVTIRYISCRLTFFFSNFSNNVDMIVFSLFENSGKSVHSHGHIAPVPNLWQDT
jgi:hypothetical protein